MNLEQLEELQGKPAPFAPGEPLFWTDPYISQQMLATHLDPGTDAASRRPETIARYVAWLIETLHLRSGQAVLDLGCGPGLYAARLAPHGLRVTGVDFSQNSINYATQYAREHNLAIIYRCQNYLALDDTELYDAALLIYGDYCALAPAQRARLLQNIYRALKPGGYFAFDVTTRALRSQYGLKNGWSVDRDGFWKPGLALVLKQGFDYPEQALYLDQYIVIEVNGKVSVYRNWFQDYAPETITAELEAGGFSISSLWGDLAGAPYEETSEWIGVVARKRS